MIDVLTDWYLRTADMLAAWGAINPHWLMAGVVVSLMLSWGVTQRLKRHIPGRRRVEALAFVLAFTFCIGTATRGALWPLPWLEVGVALVCGLSAPAAYKALVAALGSRFGWVASLRRN